MRRLHRRSLSTTKSASHPKSPPKPKDQERKLTNLVSPAAPTPNTNPTTTSTTTTPATPPCTHAPQTPNRLPPPLPLATAIPKTASIGITAKIATVSTTPCASPAPPLCVGVAPPPTNTAPRESGRPELSVPPSTKNSGELAMDVSTVKRPCATCRRRNASGERGLETAATSPGPLAKMSVAVGGRRARQAWQVRFAVRRSGSPPGEEGWRVYLRGEGRGSWWLCRCQYFVWGGEGRGGGVTI